jgi:NAD(P)-dependent dehydrogenase (short-subunit alcohol dehydrogenase family)
VASDIQLNGLRRGGVIVTGASSGIGKKCALYLDQSGYHVFAGVRNASDGEALTRAASPRLSPVFLDVTDSGTVAEAVRHVEQGLRELPLVGLVNNAGIVVMGPVEFLSPAELRRQMEVNLIGPLAVLQAFMPALRRSRGRIVNVSSISGKVAAPFIGPYSASKFALEALSDSLRAELKPWGIDVSIVEPGIIRTLMIEKGRNYIDELLRSLPAEGLRHYKQAIENLRDASPMQERIATPAYRVAKIVEQALTARRPRTRYLVGSDAKLIVFLHWLLPDRAFDAFLARINRRLAMSGSRSSSDAKSKLPAR